MGQQRSIICRFFDIWESHHSEVQFSNMHQAYANQSKTFSLCIHFAYPPIILVACLNSNRDVSLWYANRLQKMSKIFFDGEHEYIVISIYHHWNIIAGRIKWFIDITSNIVAHDSMNRFCPYLLSFDHTRRSFDTCGVMSKKIESPHME